MQDKIWFGIHKGKKFLDLPVKYLEWLVDQHKYKARDLALNALKELGYGNNKDSSGTVHKNSETK